MIINGKEYTTPQLDFKAMCKLEKMGINITNMADTPMMVIAGFVSLAMKNTLEAAQDAIQEHIVNGGSMDDISEAFNKAIEESGFLAGLRGKKKKKS